MANPSRNSGSQPFNALINLGIKPFVFEIFWQTRNINHILDHYVSDAEPDHLLDFQQINRLLSGNVGIVKATKQDSRTKVKSIAKHGDNYYVVIFDLVTRAGTDFAIVKTVYRTFEKRIINEYRNNFEKG